MPKRWSPGCHHCPDRGFRGAKHPCRSIESNYGSYGTRTVNRLSPRSQMGHAPRKDLTHPVSRARTSDRNPGATGTPDGSCRRLQCRMSETLESRVPPLVRTGGGGAKATPEIYRIRYGSYGTRTVTDFPHALKWAMRHEKI